MRPFAGAFLLVAAFVCYAATQAGASQKIIAAVVATGMTAGAVYLAYVVFCVTVWWDREGIGARHPLGRRRFVRWSDVTGGGYRRWLQAFAVDGRDERVWYSPAQTGWPALQRYMSFRLRREGCPMWHGFEMHGLGYEATLDGETHRVGFYAMVWVRVGSIDVARAQAMAAIEGSLDPLRRLSDAAIYTTLVRSMLDTPDLPPVPGSDQVRQTGLAVYR